MSNHSSTIPLALALALIAGAQSAAAAASIDEAQTGASGAHTNLFKPPSSGRTNPYGGLFAPTGQAGTAPARSRSSQPTETAKPRVVCGMTIVPVDPGIDPKMAATPQPTGTRYAIRAIQPPMCK
jgi:hypothetical protein